MEYDLLKFIKHSLKYKWSKLTDEELDNIVSAYVKIDEIHIGNICLPSVKRAVTYEEIKNDNIKIMLEWGKDNLQDQTFWGELITMINNYTLTSSIGVLVLILHFNNECDAYLFRYFWQ